MQSIVPDPADFRRRRNRSLIYLAVGTAGLAATLLLQARTGLDLAIQDALYRGNGQWLVDARAVLPKLIFYKLPKLALWILGAALLLNAFGRPRARFKFSRSESLFLVINLAALPLAVALLKPYSGLHCPSELARYGGTEEHHKLPSFSRRPYVKVRPHCYPAGHASGGFALGGFFLLTGRRKWLAIWLAAGWTMGTYQMLKGAHFLSHTLATMFLGLVLTGILWRGFSACVYARSWRRK